MPIHGRIASLAGPVVRRFIRSQSQNVYQVLKIQDRIIDKTYRKAGLYNRGLVKGIQHGLISGQIIGGFLQLGLNDDQSLTPGNNAPVQPRNGPQTSTPYKTRRGFSTRYGSRNPARCYTNIRRGRSRSRKYYRS